MIRVWFEFKQSAGDPRIATFVPVGMRPPMDKVEKPSVLMVEIAAFVYEVSRQVQEKCQGKRMDEKMEAMLPHLATSIALDMRERQEIDFDVTVERPNFRRA